MSIDWSDPLYEGTRHVIQGAEPAREAREDARRPSYLLTREHDLRVIGDLFDVDEAEAIDLADAEARERGHAVDLIVALTGRVVCR